MEFDVSVSRQAPKTFYGLSTMSNDKSISKDITALSKEYNSILNRQSNLAVPFIVCTKNYNKETGDFELFIGGKIEHEGLSQMILPQGLYGIVTVRPILGIFWGKAIGNAKRYFYNEWLPKSKYTALNMEYENHTEKSIGKKPKIDMFFAIEVKEN